MDKKIGVIGIGSVGSAVSHGLSFYFDDVKCYDINGLGKFRDIIDTDVVFICVGTELVNGRLSTVDVEDVIRNLSDRQYTGIVVIKSTVSIGFTEKMSKKHKDLRIVYAPEFLREEQSYQFFIYPDRLVLAGCENDISIVKDILSWTNCPVFEMSYKEAEVMKLVHNAKIAVDVSFTNEVKMIADSFGLDAYKIMQSVWADRRRTKFWLDPTKGPYNGKCVDKDSKEYIATTNSRIVQSADYVNQLFKKYKKI